MCLDLRVIYVGDFICIILGCTDISDLYSVFNVLDTNISKKLCSNQSHPSHRAFLHSAYFMVVRRKVCEERGRDRVRHETLCTTVVMIIQPLLPQGFLQTKATTWMRQE